MANIKRESLFFEQKNPFTTYVFTLLLQLRQAFVNMTCKSVPSSSENLGLLAVSELWGGEITLETNLKYLKNENVHNGNLFYQNE